MKIRWVVAIAVALGVALVPAAVSASSPPTVYTKSYAGYYSPITFAGLGSEGGQGGLISDWTMPSLTSLANVTNGVTTEYRLYNSAGEWDFQLGANPQTDSSYRPVAEIPGQGKVQCGSTLYPPGDVIQAEVFVDNKDYAPGSRIFFSLGDFKGNNTFCEFSFSSPQVFSKIALAGAFNPKTFKFPAHPTTLAAFSMIGISDASQLSYPLIDFPHAKYIATSTGTSTGKVRAAPSALNSTGDGFTVTLP